MLCKLKQAGVASWFGRGREHRPPGWKTFVCLTFFPSEAQNWKTVTVRFHESNANTSCITLLKMYPSITPHSALQLYKIMIREPAHLIGTSIYLLLSMCRMYFFVRFYFNGLPFPSIHRQNLPALTLSHFKFELKLKAEWLLLLHIYRLTSAASC